MVAGIGVPQLSAILNVRNGIKNKNVKIISDGGIKYSGDLAKAFAAGADAVMIGSLFAGTDETPGKLIKKNGKLFKSFRGMGSVGAMNKGSADRYFQKKQSVVTNDFVTVDRNTQPNLATNIIKRNNLFYRQHKYRRIYL